MWTTPNLFPAGKIHYTLKLYPFDKFQLGLRQLIENLMIERMADNDKIVTRYMDDKEFSSVAFEELSRAIYKSIPQSDE